MGCIPRCLRLAVARGMNKGNCSFFARSARFSSGRGRISIYLETSSHLFTVFQLGKASLSVTVTVTRSRRARGPSHESRALRIVTVVTRMLPVCDGHGHGCRIPGPRVASW
jgi:hypothetical protein